MVEMKQTIELLNFSLSQCIGISCKMREREIIVNNELTLLLSVKIGDVMLQ